MKKFRLPPITINLVSLWKAWRWYVKNRNKKHKFGWRPQFPDHRDKVKTFRVVKLPPAVDLRPGCGSILNQGNLGSCTANAIAQAYRFSHMKQKLGDFQASRLFIYYNERAMEGTIRHDAGAIIRDGFKSINKQGACSEDLWPYVTWKFTCKPKRECYTKALDNQAIEYLSLQQDSSQLKGCLAEGFPFVFGFAVYSSFMSIGGNGIMPMPAPDESAEGGHAVMCVGYDDLKQAYIVMNSWGKEWGDNGYFYMPYSYMHNYKMTSDFWTIRLVE